MYNTYMFIILYEEVVPETIVAQETLKFWDMFKQGPINMGSYFVWGDTSKFHCGIVTIILSIIFGATFYTCIQIKDIKPKGFIIMTCVVPLIFLLLIWLYPIVTSMLFPLFLIVIILQCFLVFNCYQIGQTIYAILIIFWLYLLALNNVIFFLIAVVLLGLDFYIFHQDKPYASKL